MYCSFESITQAQDAFYQVSRFLKKFGRFYKYPISVELLVDSLPPMYHASKTDITSLPDLKSPPPRIRCIWKQDQVEKAIRTLLEGSTVSSLEAMGIPADELPVLGFDLLWSGPQSLVRRRKSEIYTI